MNGFDFSEDTLDPIHVKLADYGVSRTVQSSGTKGFGGTPPFIAPEILQFAGKAQYTEKVGCEITHEILPLNQWMIFFLVDFFSIEFSQVLLEI